MIPASSIPVAGSRSGFRLDWGLLKYGLRRDAPIHMVVLMFAAVLWPFIGAHPMEWLLTLISRFTNFLLLSLVTAIALRFCVYVSHLRPASPIRQLVADAGEAMRDGFLERWLPLALTSAIFMVCFAQFKANIPELTDGFPWDATLAAWDRSLHFGRQPWEWLQPLLGWPVVTFLINLNYNMWFFFMWGMFFVFAAQASGATGRTRFLLTFFLTWAIAGNLLALTLSSAGPCYYALTVGGADPYAGLMAYLRQADTVFPIWALDVQDILWAHYQSGDADLGISAMPSLHNAMAFLMVLASRDLHPRLRPWLVAHMVLVFVGSIHLGWHYALDAYVSFAVTGAIWLAVTPIARRWDARFATGGV
jgi:hypothetical protein